MWKGRLPVPGLYLVDLAKRNLSSKGVTARISTLFFKMTIEKYL